MNLEEKPAWSKGSLKRLGEALASGQAAGGAVRTRVRDRSRAAGKRAHAVAAKLRSRTALGRDEATAAVLRSTGELAGLAQTAVRDAERLLVKRQAGGPPARPLIPQPTPGEARPHRPGPA